MNLDLPKVGILLTSHPRQHLFMRQGILSLVGFPGYVLLGYDDQDDKCLPKDEICPPVDEIFCTGNLYLKGDRRHYGSGHIRGELLQMRDGAKRLKELGCEYLFKSGADSTCYLHKGFNRLYEVMQKEQVDLVCSGTALIFGKTDALVNAMKDYPDEGIRCGSAELYFRRQMRDNKNIPHVFDLDRRKWAEWIGRVHVQGVYAKNLGLTVVHTWKIGELWPRNESPMTHAERCNRIERMREEYAVQKKAIEEKKRHERERLNGQ